MVYCTSYSVCYNWAQCVSNARLATSLALQFGSPGVLITDWGEHSYIAPLAVTLSAVAIGAGFAWTGPTQQAMPLLKTDGYGWTDTDMDVVLVNWLSAVFRQNLRIR